METPPSAAPKAKRPVHITVLFGLIGGACFSAVNFALPPLAFAVAVGLISVLGAQELYRGVRRQGGEPNDILGFIACIIFQYAAWARGGERFVSYLPAVLILLLLTALLADLPKQKPKPIINVGSTLLGVVYVGWLSSYFTLMRSSSVTGLHVPGYTTTAEWLTFFVAATTWFSDAGGLFVGRALGRRKLAPEISPAKTIEGAIGGLLCAIGMGVGLGNMLHLPIIHAVILASICAVSGLLGDLAESAFKREVNVKDFGTVLPGHGGVLDRIDSLLFSAPLAYYYVVFVLVSQGIVSVPPATGSISAQQIPIIQHMPDVQTGHR